ncbi:MAG: hypothetical protein L3J67_12645 [Hyphomicrobiaceae bacterium]|nr:hypothetical protein [Hyphomicrobiaceae bacterium]
MGDIFSFFQISRTGGEQDWDIELANASRVDEFIENYHDSSFKSQDRMALIKLILASYNDLIDDRKDQWDKQEKKDRKKWLKICDLIREEPELHREIIDYWATLKFDNDFLMPVTPLLRELQASLKSDHSND